MFLKSNFLPLTLHSNNIVFNFNPFFENMYSMKANSKNIRKNLKKIKLKHSNILKPKAMSFVGLDNFKKVFTDTVFLKSIYNTFRFTIFVVPLQLGVALGLALLVNKKLNKALVTFDGDINKAIVSYNRGVQGTINNGIDNLGLAYLYKVVKNMDSETRKELGVKEFTEEEIEKIQDILD